MRALVLILARVMVVHVGVNELHGAVINFKQYGWSQCPSLHDAYISLDERNLVTCAEQCLLRSGCYAVSYWRKYQLCAVYYNVTTLHADTTCVYIKREHMTDLQVRCYLFPFINTYELIQRVDTIEMCMSLLLPQCRTGLHQHIDASQDLTPPALHCTVDIFECIYVYATGTKLYII